MTKTVLLVQHDADSLPDKTLRELRNVFGKDVLFVRTDPKNEEEHLADCVRLSPAAVLLPPEPFWVKAQEKGYRHGAIMHGRSGLVVRRVQKQEFVFMGYGNLGFEPWPDYTPLAYYNR
jgi:hypothetical protein